MNHSRAKKNIIFSLGGQVIIMLMAIFVPRLIIGSYGSDTNGFLTTLTQIFSYMALLEAGIGQAAKNALYKPLAVGDRENTSYIISIANHYFQRATGIYALCVLVLACLYPVIIKTNIDPVTAFAVVILEGMTGVINFYFTQLCTVVFGADGRSYINHSINLANSAAVYAAKIIMAALGLNIILLQVTFLGINVIKAIFFRTYFRRKYRWVDFKAAPKTEKLKDRNSYVVNEIAWTIFFSTDTIVLSTFVGTTLSSVYAVYNLITNSLNSLWNALYGSLAYVLGQAFHRDRTEYMKLHNSFTSVFFGGMTILMCTAYVLMLPFIRLYTADVADVEYIYPALPLLFCLVQMISWSRFVSSNLLWLSGRGKIISRISIITAAINVVLSVILVNFYGIVGVLLGTVIALPMKVVCVTWISEKQVLQRNPLRYIVILGVNYLYFFAVVFLNRFIELPINSYLSFIGYGATVFLVCATIGVLLNIAVNPDCLRFFKSIKTAKKHAE